MPHSPRAGARRSLGVALISALLVVALAATAAATLMSSMQLSLRRSGNLYMRDQAWQYLLGVEAFARILLQQAIQHNKLDLLLGQERTLPVEGGVVSGRITDLQAGINLNDLVGAKGKVNATVRGWLENLFRAQKVDIKHIDALIDWLDTDSLQHGPNGAEDDYYIGLDPPYRTANTQMESLSELSLIREMKPEEIESLTRYEEDGKPVRLLNVIHKDPALRNMVTPVNINTASAPVLTALGVRNVQKVIDGRPYKKLPTPAELGVKSGKPIQGLGTESDYFLLEATAKIGRAVMRSYSIIHREKGGKMTIVARSYGTE